MSIQTTFLPEAIPATREHELAMLCERILSGDYSGLPKVDAQWYLPTDWTDAAQGWADVAGEPDDAAVALADLETMLFREVAYDGWLDLSDSEQAAYAYDPHNYFDARNRDRVRAPVDCTDAIRFPNIALACADLAAMPAAKRDRLNAEWETRNV